MFSSLPQFAALLALMTKATSAQQGPPTTAAAQAAAALQAKADALNIDFYDYVFVVLSSLIVALAIWRIGIESVKYVRTLACLNNERQLYFVKPSAAFASFKKHLLYAPIFRKRHNREFQLSAAVNVGTLPTRFQLLFIVAYLGMNVAYCVVGIDWSQPLTTVATELRDRAGILAVTNLVSHIQSGHLIPQILSSSNTASIGPPIYPGLAEQPINQRAEYIF
jgi:hypothetical protein